MVTHRNALHTGHKLHWYEIVSILGQGGFGITYLANDPNLDLLVAIKEFLPMELAVRESDSSLHPVSDGHSDTYGWGLDRFLSEAQTLARFRHPNIVRVLSVFEANNTAYMVMEYEQGKSLEDALKFRRIEGEEQLLGLLFPLLDGLELVHAAGFIHRDIKPDNIYMREDGVPVLLDFGSARQALGVATRTLTTLVSPGYAPFEQYNATRDSDRQGPWTDLFAGRHPLSGGEWQGSAGCNCARQCGARGEGRSAGAGDIAGRRRIQPSFSRSVRQLPQFSAGKKTPNGCRLALNVSPDR